MPTNILIKRYETFMGKNKFKLRDLRDLQYIHDVYYDEIIGIETLRAEDKEAFKTFLVEFFNSYGLKARSKIKPVSVYRVIEKLLWIKHHQEDGYILLSEEYIALDSFGEEKLMLYKSEDETDSNYEYRKLMCETRMEHKLYLRFDYTIDDYPQWVHILGNGYEFY